MPATHEGFQVVASPRDGSAGVYEGEGRGGAEGDCRYQQHDQQRQLGLLPVYECGATLVHVPLWASNLGVAVTADQAVCCVTA